MSKHHRSLLATIFHDRCAGDRVCKRGLEVMKPAGACLGLAGGRVGSSCKLGRAGKG